MSATYAVTAATDGLETGMVAHVTFRVRCEKLGHGEEVFLVSQDGKHRLPLYTSPAQYPWYRAIVPLTLTLPSASTTTTTNKKTSTTENHFLYRYEIHRAGVFDRWENTSDAPLPEEEEEQDGDQDHGLPQTQTQHSITITTSTTTEYHALPLHLLVNREMYTVNDVLGNTHLPVDLEHVPFGINRNHNNNNNNNNNASKDENNHKNIIEEEDGPLPKPQTLHTRASSGSGFLDPAAFVTLRGTTKTASPAVATRKKAVGFAPSTADHTMSSTPRSTTSAGMASWNSSKHMVHLNSTDGLVVVSMFLPVILQKQTASSSSSSTTTTWHADWDYEMLLSMQTHLRVTRVGVVKWRDGNETKTVPIAERRAVEECLRQLSCVPVWIDETLLDQMYNGFCKGVLWPVLHNVTSVYSSRPDDTHSGGRKQDDDNNVIVPDDFEQISDYCMDDVEQGPIHGGRGREAELWSSYNTVNRRFAEIIVQCFNEGDLVWIHGFQLLILPSYLTRRIPMAKVGIFLHTPFPSSEIFRTLWCREDLLRGMLNADQVGFHLFEYARHFLTSCRRLLGLNYGMIPDASGGHTLAIDTNGRHVVVTSIHAGVEPPVLNQILFHSSTVEKAATIRERVNNQHIFCGIDKLESLKGIPLKLLGLERFLRRCPEYVGKVVLVQVGLSAWERGEDYVRTKHEVSRLVEQINAQWPNTVQFQECSEAAMGLQQRMALLRAADTVIVTSIRDGLNLLPLEYTIAHQDALTEYGRKDGRKRGMVILSEFSSCTRVMRGALHVNPYKISEIANALHSSVNIAEDERLRRISIASEFVTRVTTQRWALAVMLDLKGVHKNVNPIQYSGAGLGLGYRLLGMDTGFTSLDTNLVAKAYRNAKARLILVDYGGTIVSNDNLDNLTRFKMVKERSVPSFPTPQMISALKGLCDDKRNVVFVVSGKERHSLLDKLHQIPNLGLAAEHGMFISWPSKSLSKRKWETLVPDTDRTWRSLAVSIMEVYTSRTHGSYIEETEMKVLWQYRDADTEFGSLQAKELEDHLSKYLRSFSVDILHGGIEEGGYVEVRPKGVNKGVLAMRVLKRYPEIAQKDRVDFALVLGDDHCDEPMLSVMRQIGRRVASARRAARGEDPLPPIPAAIQLVDVSSCDPYCSPNLEVFTCTVGKKPSAAASYLHDVDEVHELLDSLVKLSTREQRYFSSIDLRSISNEFLPKIEPQVGVPMQGVDSENIGTGMSKSLSLGELDASSQIQTESVRSVPTTLNDFLGTIDDGDEEEEMFF